MEQMKLVPFKSLRVDKIPNYRDPGKVKELAANIAEVGLLIPFLVHARKEGSEVVHDVVDGERRYRAIALLREQDPKDFASVPVILKTGNEDEMLSARLAANLHRKESNQMEIGEWAKKMKERNRPFSELAPKVGITSGRLGTLCKVATRCEEPVKDAVKAGLLSFDIAEQVFVDLTPEEQVKQLPKYIETKKKEGVREANRQVKNQAPKIPMKDRKVYLKQAERLSKSQGSISGRAPTWWEGLATGIKLGMGKGSIPKEFKSAAALEKEQAKAKEQEKPAAAAPPAPETPAPAPSAPEPAACQDVEGSPST